MNAFAAGFCLGVSIFILFTGPPWLALLNFALAGWNLWLWLR